MAISRRIMKNTEALTAGMLAKIAPNFPKTPIKMMTTAAQYPALRLCESLSAKILHTICWDAITYCTTCQDNDAVVARMRDHRQAGAQRR